MSKDAVMMIVDAGNSMDQLFSEDATRLKIAFECCKLTLQQKLFNNSNHELGLTLFGDNETDDGNSLVLQQLQKPNIQLVRKVQQLSLAKLENSKKGGDIFEALNYAIDGMEQHCKKKKYNKRIFLFTNGKGETKWKERMLKQMAQKVNQNAIKINIIPIDFMASYDVQENVLEGEIMEAEEQDINAKLLINLREIQRDNIQIFPASLAIQLYKRFRKKDTNPVALFRGDLQIAPGLKISVCTYKAVRKQKLKSLARYDTTVPFNPMIEKEKEVVSEINYIIQGDESGNIVSKQDMINAFHYGPQLVPIDTINQVGSKIHEEKNFRLLGFVDKNKIPRHCLMGEIDIVVPSPENEISQKLFTSFNYSMISLNKYGLARYVPRNYKNGVTPKMVAIIPFRSAEKEHFYLVELPTVQDVRDYPFNSLKKSTQKQQEIVGKLVEKMMLYHKVDDEEMQEVKMQNTFNPTRQYFYQTIFHRALINDGQTPPLDPVIQNYITPEVKIFEGTQYLMKNIKKQFRLIQKELPKDKAKQKNAIVWKDILQMEKDQISISKNSSELTDQTEAIIFPKMKFGQEMEAEQEKFYPNSPILSFRKLITYNKKDLVNYALEEISKYIEQKYKFTFTGNEENLRHLADCCLEMRQGCVSEQEEQFWDDWLVKCYSAYSSLFKVLRSQGIGFIKADNKEIFKAESLHVHPIEVEVMELD